MEFLGFDLTRLVLLICVAILMAKTIFRMMFYREPEEEFVEAKPLAEKIRIVYLKPTETKKCAYCGSLAKVDDHANCVKCGAPE